MPVNPKRVRTFSEGRVLTGPVVYWMSRDQRARDNWALIYARELAQERDTILAVAFCLAPEFLGATRRQYSFMLQGLREVEESLRALNIPFFLRSGDPGREIPDLLDDLGAGAWYPTSLLCGRAWNGRLLWQERSAFPFMRLMPIISFLAGLPLPNRSGPPTASGQRSTVFFPDSWKSSRQCVKMISRARTSLKMIGML